MMPFSTSKCVISGDRTRLRSMTLSFRRDCPLLMGVCQTIRKTAKRRIDLREASTERQNWQPLGDGSSIAWPALDKDLGIEELRTGRRTCKGFLIVECRRMTVGLDPQRPCYNHPILIYP